MYAVDGAAHVARRHPQPAARHGVVPQPDGRRDRRAHRAPPRRRRPRPVLRADPRRAADVKVVEAEDAADGVATFRPAPSPRASRTRGAVERGVRGRRPGADLVDRPPRRRRHRRRAATRTCTSSSTSASASTSTAWASGSARSSRTASPSTSGTRTAARPASRRTRTCRSTCPTRATACSSTTPGASRSRSAPRRSRARSSRCRASRCEYYVIHGPTPKDVLRRYTALTGRPAAGPGLVVRAVAVDVVHHAVRRGDGDVVRRRHGRARAAAERLPLRLLLDARVPLDATSRGTPRRSPTPRACSRGCTTKGLQGLRLDQPVHRAALARCSTRAARPATW